MFCCPSEVILGAEERVKWGQKSGYCVGTCRKLVRAANEGAEVCAV